MGGGGGEGEGGGGRRDLLWALHNYCKAVVDVDVWWSGNSSRCLVVWQTAVDVWWSGRQQ